MQNKSQLVLIILTVTLIINFAHLTYSADNPSGTGLSFLKLGAGSRAVGMGEACTAIANDASATYWNPAGLANLSGTELMFSHNKWLQDIKNEYAALGFQVGKNAFGVSFMSNAIEGIERRIKPSAEPVDVLTAHDIMFGLSYARLVGENFSLGTTVKYLYQKIYVESASGVAVDFGLQYKTPLPRLHTGLVLQHFGFMSKLQEESTKLPQTIRVGLAYQFPIQLLNAEFLLAMDWMKIIEGRSHLNFGFEYNFMKYLAVRLGYQTGYEDKGIHSGLGLSFNRYRLDYAYVSFGSDLGNSHLISFGVRL